MNEIYYLYNGYLPLVGLEIILDSLRDNTWGNSLSIYDPYINDEMLPKEPAKEI